MHRAGFAASYANYSSIIMQVLLHGVVMVALPVMEQGVHVGPMSLHGDNPAQMCNPRNPCSLGSGGIGIVRWRCGWRCKWRRWSRPAAASMRCCSCSRTQGAQNRLLPVALPRMLITAALAQHNQAVSLRALCSYHCSAPPDPSTSLGWYVLQPRCALNPCLHLSCNRHGSCSRR